MVRERWRLQRGLKTASEIGSESLTSFLHLFDVILPDRVIVIVIHNNRAAQQHNPAT